MGRIEAQGKTSVRVWALSKITDASGNYLTITYDEDPVNGNGDYRVARIDYTGNAAQGVSPRRSVRFEYEDRPDQISTYIGGSLVKSIKRLIKIKTYFDETLVRNYRLSYDPVGVGIRSRLWIILECRNDLNSCAPDYWVDIADDGGTRVMDLNFPCLTDGSCLPPTQFTWQGGSGYGTVAVTDPAGWGNDPRVRVGDWNNDGKMDLVTHNNGKLVVAFSRGDGNFDSMQITDPAGWDGTKAWAGDYDGDGRSDLVSHNNGKFYFAFSRFTGITGNFHTPAGVNQPSAGWDTVKTWVSDINGDGKSDLISYKGGNLVTVFNISGVDGTYQSNSVPAASWWGDCFSSSVGVTCWGSDFNGDGKSDIVNHNNGNGKLSFAFSNGDGTFDFRPAIDKPANWHTGKVWVGDMNSDGKSDLVTQGGNVLVTIFSKGDGTYHSVETPTPANWDGDHVWVGDFNNDGMTDWVFRSIRPVISFHSGHQFR